MKKYIFLLLVITFFAACKKEAALTPSNFEKNFYVIEDDPANAVQHARYQFYKDYGIPVFYTDTIGMDTQGVSPSGKPLLHYETLGIGYNPDGLNSPTYTTTYYQNLSNPQNVIDGIQFLRNNIMNVLPPGVTLKSFFLGDTVYSNVYGDKAFKGFNTVAIGSIPTISQASADVLTAFKVAILRSIVSPYILDESNADTLNKNFYGVSRAFVATGDIYNNNVFTILTNANASGNNYYGEPFSGDSTSLYQFGFLGRNATYFYRYA